MKTTISIKKEQVEKGADFQRKWFCVDASGKTLGRLSSEISKILRGKNKPFFTPHVDTGDYVIVVNAEKIHLSGTKWKKKIYSHHTGFPGGLRQIKAEKLLEKHPTQLLQSAVKGMMPKNQLNRNSIFKLKIYAGPEHPHQAQKPETLELYIWNNSTERADENLLLQEYT